MTSGRTSRDPNQTRAPVATDRPADDQNMADRLQPRRSTTKPPSTGPTADPIDPETPNSAITVPIRARGTTSRIPASITPVLPSWNPIRSRLRPSCHGWRDSATAPNTTASTRQLRTMTALRLYLSAQTPHSGTSGIPTTKTSAENNPTNGTRSASGTPISWRYGARNEKTWETPKPSTRDVIEKTATTRRQSSRPAERSGWTAGEPTGSACAGVDMRTQPRALRGSARHRRRVNSAKGGVLGCSVDGSPESSTPRLAGRRRSAISTTAG